LGVREADDVAMACARGENDNRVTRGEVEAVYQNLAGEKELVFCPSAGHEACYSAGPDFWRRQVDSFLSRHMARSELSQSERRKPN
jgi:hypothetical protein